MACQGFTLIELLVVVAIIVTLIAILMPALASARLQAKVVACSSNVRQYGFALQMYTSEYNGSFAASMGTGTAAYPQIEGHNETAGIAQYRRYFGPGVGGNYVYATNPSRRLPSLKVERCPTDEYVDEFHISYACVSMGYTDRRIKASFYENPQVTPIIYDSDFIRGTEYGRPFWWVDNFVFRRHNNVVNQAFVDGHVEVVKIGSRYVNNDWLWWIYTNGTPKNLAGF